MGVTKHPIRDVRILFHQIVEVRSKGPIQKIAAFLFVQTEWTWCMMRHDHHWLAFQFGDSVRDIG